MARKSFPEDRPHGDSRLQELPVMDESDIPRDARKSAYQEASKRLVDFSDRRDMFICGGTSKSEVNQKILRYDCTLLAMGRSHILNCRDAATLARLHGVSKARVNFLIKRFQAFMSLPPTAGQRNGEQCANMAETRNGKLKHCGV